MLGDTIHRLMKWADDPESEYMVKIIHDSPPSEVSRYHTKKLCVVQVTHKKSGIFATGEAYGVIEAKRLAIKKIEKRIIP